MKWCIPILACMFVIVLGKFIMFMLMDRIIVSMDMSMCMNMLMFMCMSYQSSSGIYVVMVLFLAFKDWNSGTKAVNDIRYLSKSGNG